MGKTETALNYFDEKFHCSQAVLAAYASELGLTEEQALEIDTWVRLTELV